MPEVRNPGLGAGQQAMLVATTNLTAAQIRALNSSPITVVGAPGAGKLLLPLGVALVYSFGTRAYKFPTGGADNIDLQYSPSADGIGITFTNTITGGVSTFTYSGAFPGPVTILPGDDNSAIRIIANFNYTNGPIATATLGAGSAGYAPNDTGTITTGSGDATYKVLTVGGGGAVLTFQITGAGTSYATGNGQATAVGGAQPGVGAGFTVNITAVNAGDGTLKVVTFYQIIPVP